MRSPEALGVAPVAGVVLAAGFSKRMGTNKLLLALDGESIVRRAVRSALEAKLSPVIVVLGHEAERARDELSGLEHVEIFNPDAAAGIHTSLRAGLRAVPASAPAAVVLLADMPFVTARMIAALVGRYREASASLVISDYDGVQAPPTLYDRSLFAELFEEEGEGCSKRVVNRHRADGVAVSWPAAALTDVDQPQDFERVRTELARPTPGPAS